MLSSGAETAPALWAALARLRDVSRLVLAAIERDDLDQVHRCSREADVLVASVRAYQESGEPLSEEACEMIEQITVANQRVVDGLQGRIRETSAELARSRDGSSRLKAVKMPPTAATAKPTLLDRNT